VGAAELTGANTMIAEIQRLVVLAVAFGLFLFAGQTAASLTWRGAPAQVVVASQ